MAKSSSNRFSLQSFHVRRSGNFTLLNNDDIFNGLKTTVFHLHAIRFLFSFSRLPLYFRLAIYSIALIKLFVWGYNDDGSNKSNSVAYSNCFGEMIRDSSNPFETVIIFDPCHLHWLVMFLFFPRHNSIVTTEATKTMTAAAARTTKIHSTKRNDTMLLFSISCQDIFRGVLFSIASYLFMQHVVSFTKKKYIYETKTSSKSVKKNKIQSFKIKDKNCDAMSIEEHFFRFVRNEYIFEKWSQKHGKKSRRLFNLSCMRKVETENNNNNDNNNKLGDENGDIVK